MIEEGRCLASIESVESRWVFEDDGEGVSSDDDLPPHMALDYSEDDDGGEQRLIRTAPRVDSFDVEALKVPGAQRLDYEDFSHGKKIVLVFQTLGVVFGDVATSPLYTFDVMFNKAPING